jgi:hypothetical protein
MQGSNKQFKRAILKNLLLRLLTGGGVASRRGLSLHERKNAVRHAADAALATARGTAPRWSRSLAADLSHGPDLLRPADKNTSSECRPMCRRILRRQRRSLLARPKSKATAKTAGVLARAMARRRIRALREVVPGGRGMDDCTLLDETLDYAVSLKAQVDAMQLLVRALQAPTKNSPAGESHLKLRMRPCYYT